MKKILSIALLLSIVGCASPTKVNMMEVESYSGMNMSGSFVGYSDNGGSFNGRTVILNDDGSGYHCGLSFGGVAVVEKLKFSLDKNNNISMVLGNGYGFKVEKMKNAFIVKDQFGETKFMKSNPSVECKLKLRNSGIEY